MNRFEVELGLTQPAGVFSLFENAMRFARGESIQAHRDRISKLWARFNAVAQDNPYAWTREPLSPAEIGTPSPSNKLVSHPYTKRLCANMVVDQAAAVIVCSAATAMRLGVERERWVYLHSAADVQKAPLVSERWDFQSAPALGMAARRALELAGTHADEIAHVDLYSCFPAAVQLAAAELGRSLEPAPTATGGLGFAGGPFNSYVLHSTSAMMSQLRRDPGSLGLVSSIGGWLNKHAFAVYSTRRPEAGFQHADLDRDVRDLPVRSVEQDTVGAATVETYTLRCINGAPVAAIVPCLRENGTRVWATTEDSAVLDAMTREEFCGRRVSIRDGGTLDAG
jgi:acetyl-CoA C-acetyltransferase